MGPRHVAVPVLLLLPRRGDAGRGTVELDTGAQNRLHPIQHGRVVEQEGEGLVLFEELVDKLLAVPARKGRIECCAQSLNLLPGDGIFDDEVAPLAERRPHPRRLRDVSLGLRCWG